MKKYTRVHLRFLVLIFLLAIFLASCETTESLQDEFKPSGTYKLEWNDLPDIGSGLKLGGFSGLFYKGGRIFYTVTSRGPVITNKTGEVYSSYFLLPAFAPQIVKLELQNDGTIKVVERIKIKNPLNEICTGRIPQDAWSEDESLTNSDSVNSAWGIDPSGIYFDIDANLFYVSEQYSPSILQVTSRGNWFRRASPGEGLRHAYAFQTYEGGIAGIDVTARGNFLFAIARSLEHNRNINDPNKTRPINYYLRRIGIYYPDSRHDISMFYFVDSTESSQVARTTELGDVEFVNDTTYLVTEISTEAGMHHAKLYEAIVTDSTSKVQEGLEGIEGKSFETLTNEEWAQNGLHPLKKVFVLDLADFGFNNPKGIEIIDASHLAVIENNNFGIVDGNAQTHKYKLDRSPIKLEIVELPISLDLK